MRIRPADNKDQSAWDAFVRSHPQGTAYHQFAWKEAVEKAYGFQGMYLLAERGQEVCAVLPLIHMKSLLLGGRMVSLPYCDVGGCLAEDEEAAAALLDVAKSYAARGAERGLELRWGFAHQGASGCVDTQHRKVRMILDLPQNAERLLAGLKAKLRSQVNKPQRDGLTAKLGGSELIDDFYGIFAENMRALGSPVHSREWLAAVVEAFADQARVGVVYTPEGVPAAGGIILLHPQMVSIPWASSLRRLNHLNPNMLLYWTFLSFAADGGYVRFDFGRSTPSEGTYRFKEQWGARPHPLYWDVEGGTPSGHGAGQLARNARRIAETLWSRLPLRVTTLLGPPLRRNISL